MTNSEKIKEAERLIAEANKLIAEVKNSKDGENILADYIDAFTVRDRMYYIDSNGDIDFVMYDLPFDATDSNPYGHYPTKELAEQAKAMKDFNDKLLAFKYCYDLDYKPNWDDIHSTDGSDAKFYVYFDSTDYKYHCRYCHTNNCNTVYFSSEEIAQKCADWLNLKED